MSGATQTSYSEWQKRPVPTFRPGGKGSSLQETIEKAPPYSRIMVIGGIYNEQLVINKPIELIGEEGEEPIVQHKGPVVSIHNDVECYIQRVSFVAKTTNKNNNKEAPAILVGGHAKPVFKSCEITSVMVTTTADPQFVMCTIGKNVNGPCISVRDHASGTYLQNKFRDCVGYCIEVCSRGEPRFIDNTVEADTKDPTMAGNGLLHVYGGKDVRPVFTSNRFEDFVDANAVARYVNTVMYSSRRTAVVIDGFAEPLFEDNVFIGSELCVTLRACGGVFRNNTITSSRSCGLYVRTGCSMLLSENKIQGNATYGVVLDGCDCAVLDGNHISNNSHCGCLIVHSSQFTLTNNHFVSNAGGGLCVWENAKGTIAENDFKLNQRYGAYFYGAECAVSFRQNRLANNGPTGVICENGSTPQLIENEITQSPVAGLWITTSANPAVVKNSITDCDRYCVIVTANGRGKLLKNILRGGRESTLFVTDGANPIVSENDISEGSISCILVSEGGIGIFNGNKIRNGAFGVACRLFADPYFHGNFITNCGEGGIASEEEGVGTFVENIVEKCANGLLCDRGGEAVFRNNLIKECSASGALMKGGSRALIEKNKFDSNAIGINIRGEDAQPIIRHNQVSNSTTYGVVSAEKATGEFSNNHVLLSGTAALACVDEGNTLFVKNRCTQDRGHGILCRRGGCSKYRDNFLEFTCGSGVLIDQGGRPDIADCTFTGAKGYGIEIAHASEGKIENCKVIECEIGFKGHGSCKTAVNNVVFDGNKEFGGIVVDNAEAILKKCTFKNHPKIALAVRNAAASLFDECEFLDNNMDVESSVAGSLTTLKKCRMAGEKCKIHVDYHASGDVRLDDCEIEDGEVGIRFHDRARGHIQDTNFSRLTKQALLCENQSQGSVTSCYISECEIGCEATTDSKCHIQDTIFFKNGCNILLGEKSVCEFSRCDIKKATVRPGVDCSKSLGSFTSCRILENEYGGVRACGQRTRTSFTDCQISDNGMYGIEGSDRAESNFVNCTIEHNRGPGIIFAYHAALHFSEKNTVRNNGYFGIICEDGADGLFSTGMITSHLTSSNIKLDPGSQTRIERNKITNAKFGIVAEGSNSLIAHNTITDCKFCAIQCCGKSAVTFDSNEIHDNTAAVSFAYEFDTDYHLNGGGSDGNNNNMNSSTHGSDDINALLDGKNPSSSNLQELLKKRRSTALAQQGLSTSGGLVTKSTVPRRVVSSISGPDSSSSNNQQTDNNASFRRLVSFAGGNDANNTNDNKNGSDRNGLRSPTSPSNSSAPRGSVLMNGSLTSFVAEQSALSDSVLLEELMKQKKASNPFERRRPAEASRVNNAHPTSAIFRNNTFHNNGFDGAVKISQWSAPIFHQNTFRDEKKAVVVQDDGRGNVEDNTFTENGIAISITGPNCACVIAHNKFIKNKNSIELLKLISQSNFQIGENIIEDSTGYAIVAKEGCECSIESFEIKGGQNGLLICGESKVNITECTFSSIQECAIVVETLAAPEIRKCRFDSGCGIGIRLADCGALVENCVFVGATVAGCVLEHTACKAKVTKCLFTQNAAENDSVGVLFRNRSFGEVSLCDFHENSFAIRSEDHAEGMVMQCLIHRQVGGGVLCTSNATTRFRKCSFAQNSIVDLLSQGGARPELQRCLFRGDAVNGIKCSSGGCIATDCAFRGYTEAAVHFHSGAGATVSRSYFTQNEAAFFTTGKSPGHACDFVSNLVENCRYGGRIHLGPGASFNNNIVRNCEVMGLEMRHLGQGCTVSHNFITKCGDRGIRVLDLQPNTVETATTVDHNIITDFSTGYAVELGGGPERTFIFQENYIFGNCRNGLNVVDGSPRVVRNQISMCDHGMTIQKKCDGFFEGNVTHSCARIGTLIYSEAADVQKNHFCSTGESGALEVKNEHNTGSRQGGNVKNNDIKNNYVPHWAKSPDVPTPDFVTVTDIRLSKEEQNSMTVLRAMYEEDQLPSGPECLCDLVAPIAPTARDVSRVNMLARPKGQSKSASERAAEALEAAKKGNNNNEASLAGSFRGGDGNNRRNSSSNASNSPLSPSSKDSNNNNNNKSIRDKTKSAVKKVTTMAKLSSGSKSMRLKPDGAGSPSASLRSKSFASSPTGTMRKSVRNASAEASSSASPSSPKPPRSTTMTKSMRLSNTANSRSMRVQNNKDELKNQENNNNNEKHLSIRSNKSTVSIDVPKTNNDDDDYEQQQQEQPPPPDINVFVSEEDEAQMKLRKVTSTTTRRSGGAENDDAVFTESMLQRGFGDGPTEEKSEVIFGSDDGERTESHTSSRRSTQYSSNAELLSLSSGGRQSQNSNATTTNNRNQEETSGAATGAASSTTTNHSHTQYEDNNSFSLQQQQQQQKSPRSIIAHEIIDADDSNVGDQNQTFDDDENEEQENENNNNVNNDENEEEYEDAQSLKEREETQQQQQQSDNDEQENINNKNDHTEILQTAAAMTTSSSFPPPRKDSSSSKQVHTIVMSLGGSQLHPTASMDQTRIQRELAQQESHEVIHGGFHHRLSSAQQHQQQLQQQLQQQQQQSSSPRKALQAMQMSLASKDNVIRQRVRENASGISIRQSQQNWMLQNFSNNNNKNNNNSDNKNHSVGGSDNNNNNNESPHSFYTGQEGQHLSAQDRQKLLSTLMSQANRDRTAGRAGGASVLSISASSEQRENDDEQKHHNQLVITNNTSNSNKKSRTSTNAVGFATATVNTNVEDLYRHRSHESELVHPIEEEEDELPVGESFQITSLSYEHGQEMQDGVAVRSIKQEFVSPSALEAREEDDGEFDPKKLTYRDGGDGNNNNDDPDLESPTNRTNKNKNENGDGDEDEDDDYKKYLQEEERQPDEVEGIYSYEGRNQKKKFVPSPPPPPVDAQTARTSGSTTTNQQQQHHHQPYSKTARVHEKVKGYAKDMGIAFYSNPSSTASALGLRRGSLNKERLWGTSPVSIPISKRKATDFKHKSQQQQQQHHSDEDNYINNQQTQQQEEAVVDQEKVPRPAGGHLPYHDQDYLLQHHQQQQRHWSTSAPNYHHSSRKNRNAISPTPAIRASSSSSATKREQQQQQQTLRIAANIHEGENGRSNQSKTNDSTKTNMQDKKHPSPLRHRNNDPSSPSFSSTTRVLTDGLRHATTVSPRENIHDNNNQNQNQQQHFSTVPERTRTDKEDPTLTEVAIRSIRVANSTSTTSQYVSNNTTAHSQGRENTDNQEHHPHNEDADAQTAGRGGKHQKYAIESDIVRNQMINNNNRNLLSSAPGTAPAMTHQQNNNNNNNNKSIDTHHTSATSWWNEQLAALRVSGKKQPITTIAPDGTLIVHEDDARIPHHHFYSEGGVATTSLLPPIQEPREKPLPPRSNEPPPIATYLSKKQQEKIKKRRQQQQQQQQQDEEAGNDNNNDTINSPTTSTGIVFNTDKRRRERRRNNNTTLHGSSSSDAAGGSTSTSVAAEAARLQKNSRDVRRTDLFHSTTAQMFAAFDRRAGALGKIM